MGEELRQSRHGGAAGLLAPTPCRGCGAVEAVGLRTCLGCPTEFCAACAEEMVDGFCFTCTEEIEAD